MIIGIAIYLVLSLYGQVYGASTPQQMVYNGLVVLRTTAVRSMFHDFLDPIPQDTHLAVFSMCSLLKKHMELKAYMEEEDASPDIQAADVLLGHVVDDICDWVHYYNSNIPCSKNDTISLSAACLEIEIYQFAKMTTTNLHKLHTDIDLPVSFIEGVWLDTHFANKSLEEICSVKSTDTSCDYANYLKAYDCGTSC